MIAADGARPIAAFGFMQATRSSALHQFQTFRPKIPDYSHSRNHVQPDHDNVSRLSAHLRHRLITEDEMTAQTLQAHGFASAEKWLQEVHWRRYWKAWLELRPSVWRDWKQQAHQLPDQLSTATRQRIDAVQSAAGGIAVMDAFTRELITTGYLHNHVRMWWASYWIHVERLPWELGAAFFMQHLLDADPASNTLSWRWVAGLQTAGKTYLVRRSNIEKYLHPIADTSGLDRLDDDRVEAVLLPPEKAQLEPPAPPPPLPTNLSGPIGLWLHEEDLSPETCDTLHSLKFSSGLLAGLPAQSAGFPASPLQQSFRLQAMNDARERCQQHFDIEFFSPLPDSDLTSRAAHWVQTLGLRHVVTMQPFQGDLRDRLPDLQAALHQNQCQLHLVPRASDLQLLPSATRGFFPFWQSLRQTLASKSQ
jgi:deoxyribodipyrimidine photo-lyase